MRGFFSEKKSPDHQQNTMASKKKFNHAVIYITKRCVIKEALIKCCGKFL